MVLTFDTESLLLCIGIFRPHLAWLHFTSETIYFFGFNSTNSSIGVAEAILINRLAKQLHM
jgi:hypothetical protein